MSNCLKNTAIPCSVTSDPLLSEVSVTYQDEINDFWTKAHDSFSRIYTEVNNDYAFIGMQKAAMILGTSAGSATTFAANASCSVPLNCTLSGGSSGSSFSCPDGFAASAVQSKFLARPWFHSDNSFEARYNQSRNRPLEWGIFANLSDLNIFTEGNDSKARSIYNVRNGNSSRSPVSFRYAAFLLRCSSDIFEAQYSWLNDTITNTSRTAALDRKVPEDIPGNIVQGPLLAGFTSSHSIDTSSFFKGLTFPSGNVSDTAIASVFEIVISQLSLSFLGGCLIPTRPTSIQMGRSQIVTVVPKSALYVLLLLNVWYAGLGLFLYLLACYVMSRSGFSIEDIVAVQKLLSVSGLTKSAVNDAREKLRDDVRIGVVQVEQDDGTREWRFQVWDCDSWNATEGEQERKGLLQDHDGGSPDAAEAEPTHRPKTPEGKRTDLPNT